MTSGPHNLHIKHRLATNAVLPICAVVIALAALAIHGTHDTDLTDHTTDPVARIPSPDEARAAVDHIQRFGGQVFYDSELDDTGLLSQRHFLAHVEETPPSGDVVYVGLADELKNFQDVAEPFRFFSSYYPARDPSAIDFAILRQLPHIKVLDVGDRRITNADLSHIKTLKALECLVAIDAVNVTDSGIRHLAGLRSLRLLSLDQAPISDAALVNLGKLATLERLDLYGTHITDSGLQHLKPLTKLRVLDLRHTSIGDRGLQQLASLDKLTHLYLGNTKITDAGLVYLRSHHKLMWLDLTETATTFEARSKLNESLPNHPVVN